MLCRAPFPGEILAATLTPRPGYDPLARRHPGTRRGLGYMQVQTVSRSSPLGHRVLFLAVIPLLSLGLSACGGSSSANTRTTPALTSVTVSPTSGSIRVGATTQLLALASYSDGSQKDVTSQAAWTSSNTGDASVAAGLVTGVATGSSTITATFSGKSGNANLTIVGVTSVAVTSPSSSVVDTQFLPLTATATYSDSSTQDVTTTATWTSSDNALATVSTLGVVKGLAATSAVTITATFGGQSGPVSLAVVKEGISTVLTLFPTEAWTYLNSTLQMTATYTPSGGKATDVTTQATWTSTNPAKASVNAGLVRGLVGDGEVLISATYQGVTTSTLVTVSHTPLANNIPLMDMKSSDKYMGFSGGLYESSSNTPPSDHHDPDGVAFGKQIQPLDINGNPSANGAIAFISVGLSNTSLEFGGFVNYVADPSRSAQVNPRLAVLNGAKPGEAACSYVDPVLAPIDTCTIPPFVSNDKQNQYDRIRDEVLATATGAPGVTSGCGTTANPCLSEKQVQVVWVKEASPAPEGSGFSTLCDPSTAGCVNDVTTTEALHFEQQLGQMARALRVRYPNLKQVFLASRIYAGYIIVDKSPEPFAYEYGFSAKWAIQAQIDQIRGQGADPIAGDLNYNNGTAAWMAWGPYLWANGANPRSDGLEWIRDTDYQTKDYQHPSSTGISKIDGLLFTFFTTSTYTPWFRP